MSYSTLEPILQYSHLIALALSVYALYAYIWYMYRSDAKGESDYEKLGNLAIDDNLDSSTINTSKKRIKWKN